MSKISWTISKEEQPLIRDIAARAVKLAKQYGVAVTQLEMSMDITACHANGQPLNLAELLASDDGNFGHDVFGISRHLDRDTGKLQDFFTPRFAARHAS